MLENPHTFLMKTGSKNRGCCKNLCDTVYSYKLYLNGQTCIPRLCYNKDSSRLQVTSRKPAKRSMNCNSFLMFTMTVEKAWQITMFIVYCKKIEQLFFKPLAISFFITVVEFTEIFWHDPFSINMSDPFMRLPCRFVNFFLLFLKRCVILKCVRKKMKCMSLISKIN